MSKAKERAEDKKEEMKKKHDHKKRADGGKVMDATKPETDDETKGYARKRGGSVPGKMAMSRPDRRARGGATSDMNPLSSAGKMSSLSYETKQAKGGSGMTGPDRSS